MQSANFRIAMMMLFFVGMPVG